jgi:hypothetical protein
MSIVPGTVQREVRSTVEESVEMTCIWVCNYCTPVIQFFMISTTFFAGEFLFFTRH